MARIRRSERRANVEPTMSFGNSNENGCEGSGSKDGALIGWRADRVEASLRVRSINLTGVNYMARRSVTRGRAWPGAVCDRRLIAAAGVARSRDDVIRPTC